MLIQHLKQVKDAGRNAYDNAILSQVAPPPAW